MADAARNKVRREGAMRLEVVGEDTKTLRRRNIAFALAKDSIQSISHSKSTITLPTTIREVCARQSVASGTSTDRAFVPIRNTTARVTENPTWVKQSREALTRHLDQPRQQHAMKQLLTYSTQRLNQSVLYITNNRYNGAEAFVKLYNASGYLMRYGVPTVLMGTAALVGMGVIAPIAAGMFLTTLTFFNGTTFLTLKVVLNSVTFTTQDGRLCTRILGMRPGEMTTGKVVAGVAWTALKVSAPHAVASWLPEDLLSMVSAGFLGPNTQTMFVYSIVENILTNQLEPRLPFAGIQSIRRLAQSTHTLRQEQDALRRAERIRTMLRHGMPYREIQKVLDVHWRLTLPEFRAMSADKRTWAAARGALMAYNCVLFAALSGEDAPTLAKLTGVRLQPTHLKMFATFFQRQLLRELPLYAQTREKLRKMLWDAGQRLLRTRNSVGQWVASTRAGTRALRTLGTYPKAVACARSIRVMDQLLFQIAVDVTADMVTSSVATGVASAGHRVVSDVSAMGGSATYALYTTQLGGKATGFAAYSQEAFQKAHDKFATSDAAVRAWAQASLHSLFGDGVEWPAFDAEGMWEHMREGGAEAAQSIVDAFANLAEHLRDSGELHPDKKMEKALEGLRRAGINTKTQHQHMNKLLEALGMKRLVVDPGEVYDDSTGTLDLNEALASVQEKVKDATHLTDYQRYGPFGYKEQLLADYGVPHESILRARGQSNTRPSDADWKGSTEAFFDPQTQSLIELPVQELVEQLQAWAVDPESGHTDDIHRLLVSYRQEATRRAVEAQDEAFNILSRTLEHFSSRSPPGEETGAAVRVDAPANGASGTAAPGAGGATPGGDVEPTVGRVDAHRPSRRTTQRSAPPEEMSEEAVHRLFTFGVAHQLPVTYVPVETPGLDTQLETVLSTYNLEFPVEGRSPAWYTPAVEQEVLLQDRDTGEFVTYTPGQVRWIDRDNKPHRGRHLPAQINLITGESEWYTHGELTERLAGDTRTVVFQGSSIRVTDPLRYVHQRRNPDSVTLVYRSAQGPNREVTYRNGVAINVQYGATSYIPRGSWEQTDAQTIFRVSLGGASLAVQNGVITGIRAGTGNPYHTLRAALQHALPLLQLEDAGAAQRVPCAMGGEVGTLEIAPGSIILRDEEGRAHARKGYPAIWTPEHTYAAHHGSVYTMGSVRKKVPVSWSTVAPESLRELIRSTTDGDGARVEGGTVHFQKPRLLFGTWCVSAWTDEWGGVFTTSVEGAVQRVDAYADFSTEIARGESLDRVRAQDKGENRVREIESSMTQGSHVTYRTEQGGEYVLHRENGPAVLYSNGSVEWYTRGELVRGLYVRPEDGTIQLLRVEGGESYHEELIDSSQIPLHTLNTLRAHHHETPVDNVHVRTEANVVMQRIVNSGVNPLLEGEIAAQLHVVRRRAAALAKTEVCPWSRTAAEVLAEDSTPSEETEAQRAAMLRSQGYLDKLLREQQLVKSTLHNAESRIHTMEMSELEAIQRDFQQGRRAEAMSRFMKAAGGEWSKELTDSLQHDRTLLFSQILANRAASPSGTPPPPVESRSPYSLQAQADLIADFRLELQRREVVFVDSDTLARLEGEADRARKDMNRALDTLNATYARVQQQSPLGRPSAEQSSLSAQRAQDECLVAEAEWLAKKELYAASEQALRAKRAQQIQAEEASDEILRNVRLTQINAALADSAPPTAGEERREAREARVALEQERDVLIGQGARSYDHQSLAAINSVGDVETAITLHSRTAADRRPEATDTLRRALRDTIGELRELRAQRETAHTVVETVQMIFNSNRYNQVMYAVEDHLVQYTLRSVFGVRTVTQDMYPRLVHVRGMIRQRVQFGAEQALLGALGLSSLIPAP